MVSTNQSPLASLAAYVYIIEWIAAFSLHPVQLAQSLMNLFSIVELIAHVK